MTTGMTIETMKGVPPSLEWVPIARLSVDDAYQRSLDNTPAQRLIDKIASGWDWRLFQPLNVARRDDGSLWVIDGQHRLAAARQRGDLPHLPCVISAFDGVTEEASAFAAMNRQRRSMTKLEVYRAEIAAGEPRALLANSLIERAGLKLAVGRNTDNWAPGTVDCIAGVVRAIDQHGQAVALNALTAMGEAWGSKRILCSGSVLAWLVAIYHVPPAGFDPDVLIAGLAETNGRELWDDASGFSHLYTKPAERMRAAILERATP